jgi:hypothetical protein
VEGAGVDYRVAYDVLREGYDLRFSLAMLVPFLFGVGMTVVIWRAALHDLSDPDRSKRRLSANPLLGFALPPLITLCFGWGVCRPVVAHWRARVWAEGGDYEVAEGPVSGVWHGPKDSTLFAVSGVPFHYRVAWDAEGGGFRGTFTAPGVPADALRPGTPVRVAHHGDCILRIEIAELPPGDPGGGAQPP